MRARRIDAVLFREAGEFHDGNASLVRELLDSDKVSSLDAGIACFPLDLGVADISRDELGREYDEPKAVPPATRDERVQRGARGLDRIVEYRREMLGREHAGRIPITGIIPAIKRMLIAGNPFDGGYSLRSDVQCWTLLLNRRAQPGKPERRGRGQPGVEKGLGRQPILQMGEPRSTGVLGWAARRKVSLVVRIDRRGGERGVRRFPDEK